MKLRIFSRKNEVASLVGDNESVVKAASEIVLENGSRYFNQDVL